MASPTNNPKPQYITDTATVPAAQPSGLMEPVPTYGGNYAGGSSGYSYAGNIGSGGTSSATTRGVNANELSGTQLNSLIAGNSPYMRLAASRGAEMAAARGSAAGSYYGGAAHRAAIEAAAPFAMQQAGVYANTASENMAAQNQAAIENARNEVSLGIAGAQAESNLRIAMMRSDLEREQNALSRNYQREESQLGREFTAGENRLGREFQSSENQRGRDFTANENRLNRDFSANQARLDRRMAIFGSAVGTVLGNPEYLRDPSGASGLFNFVNTEFDKMFPDNLFGG